MVEGREVILRNVCKQGRGMTCKNWYDKSYEKHGFSAQRLYPNEEFLRFLGRNFFKIPFGYRKNIKLLEVGCGSGANLWAAAREGFDCYGIDFSKNSIELCTQMLNKWNTSANLYVGDMKDLPYNENYFDIIVDIFSSYCLSSQDFISFLTSVKKVLKPKGMFFSYHPSTESDAFINYHPTNKIDEWTLDGIKRKDSPYVGNDYPIRFISPQQYQNILELLELKMHELEIVDRSYNKMSEKFQFVVISAYKSY
ncbi:MAG: class I SAM-dependent methyltransferase [Oligoflexia bacterium]|nr:class I SAM-dependent methyltransferase [Oligoflexia bacterium]